MKVYIVENIQDWGDTRKILGVFKNKNDAIKMAIESDLDLLHAVLEFELID